MALNFKKQATDEADLDVTSFMNLMIVLVPVLLLSLTFSQVTVLEIKLPELSDNVGENQDVPPQLEVMIANTGYKVFYPENILIQEIPLIDVDGVKEPDTKTLSLVMQELKKQLNDKREVIILSEKNVTYQNLVSTMDAVKSYKTVVAASVVEIELFPEISLAESSE
ncbi:MAG: biopolymer transporter ExbD [Pseudomonadota bacterium]